MDKPPPIAGFDWDSANLGKCRKRGATAQEIEALLAGTPHVALDEKPSVHEARFLAVGRNGVGRRIFVVFTLRKGNGGFLIRPISAGTCTRKR